MRALYEAMAQIRDAREDVDHADVRTELESIAVSLEEMLDTADGERTDGDAAFGDTDFAGAAPHEDNLAELEENLDKLARNVDRGNVREHLVAARQQISEYRLEQEE